MSMAGANPSLTVGIMTDSSMLGTGLAQAEAQIRQSTDRMGRTVDAQMSKIGTGITRQLTGLVAAGFAVNVVDQTLKTAIESLKTSGSFLDAGIAAGEQFNQGLRAVPIVGTIAGGIVDGYMLGFDSVLDLVPQFVVDLDKKLYQTFGALTPFGLGFGFLSSAQNARTEGAIGQSRAEAAQLQIEQARRRDAEIANELESLQQRQRGMSPIEEQLQRMGGAGIASVETSIGSFRFGEADASAQLVKAAREQVEILAKIRDLQAEQAANMKLTN